MTFNKMRVSILLKKIELLTSTLILHFFPKLDRTYSITQIVIILEIPGQNLMCKLQGIITLDSWMSTKSPQ